MRSILENPRYTGFAFFGRWARQEMLLDPDDVAAGNVVRFRRAKPDKVVRSRKPAHPRIMSVQDFTQTQLMRRAKAAGGLRTARKTERPGRTVKYAYLFRGLIRCIACGRKMEGSPQKHGMYYRCSARTLTPGSPALLTHPPTIYLKEEPLRDALNEWIGGLFDRQNIAQTVEQLVKAQPTPKTANDGAARKLLEDAEARLQRFQNAISAGVDPSAVVEGINRAQADRAAAQAELMKAGEPAGPGEAEVYAMIDSLGDVGAALSGGRPEKLATLYRELRLDLRYDNEKETVCATVSPRVNNVRVRGGTRTHVRSIHARDACSCDGP
ncbi:zinc ribbon domain-containing protein [Amycolatopsis minnesotensis]|uniref:Recombinase zinc beta ribbon domain-containing protein n=1 Tax=Amycolatopsis minnesotensis TaxID=337894 RepID=A0ABN2PZY1_9PSEU